MGPDINWGSPYTGAPLTIDPNSQIAQNLNFYTGTLKGPVGGVGSIGSDSPTWGQPIPITWGKVKISVPVLQMLPLKRKYELLRSYAYGIDSHSSVSGTDYATYFTADFVLGLGYSGDTTRRKIINRLWLDGTLVYQANSASANRQRFVFFPESETAPIADQLAAGTVDPVAYRGLNWLLMLDTPINSPGYLRKTMPKVDIELFDYAITSTPATNFTPLTAGSPGPGVSNSSTFYDWDDGYLFTVDTNDVIHKWNVITGDEIDNYPITNKTTPWSNVGASTACTSFIKINGKRFITAEMDNGSNLDYFVVIDLDTGAVTDYFGLSTTGGAFFTNDYGADKIANQFTHMPLVTGIVGSQQAYVLMGTLGGGEYLWQINDAGQLIYRGHDNAYPRPKTASQEGVLDHDTGDCYFIVSREPSSGGAETTDLLVVTRGGNVRYIAAPFAASGLTLIAAFPTADDCFVLFETNGTTAQIRKVDPINLTVVKTLSGGSCPPFPSGATISPTWQQSNTQGLFIGWMVITGNTFYKLDMLAMTYTSWTLAPTPTVTGVPVYDSIDNKFYDASGTAVKEITVGPQDTDRVELSDILLGLCVRAGYDPADVIIENIDDLVTGAIISAAFNLRDVLNNLKEVYRFRIVERGGKLVLTRRARGASFTNPDWVVQEEDRCVLDEEEGVYLTIRTRRTTDTNVPSKVSLTYIGEDYNYLPFTYTYQRPDGTTVSEKTADYTVPIVMTQAEAAALAARITYDTAAARMEHEFRLPQAFLAMEPGDTINLYRDGFIDLVQVDELTVNGDFTIDVKATSITSTPAPTYLDADITSPEIDEPVLYGDGRSALLVLDTTPLVQGQAFADDRNPIYYAVYGDGRGEWPGAGVYSSKDAGDSYDLIGQLKTEAIIGRCLTTLTDTNSLGIDRTTAGDINVRFTSGDKTRVATVTTTEMLNGKNRILIGDVGRWELIGFETATHNADGSTTLSGTVRGMRGTDVFMGTHTSTDRVVYIDDAADQPFYALLSTSQDGNIQKVKAGGDASVLRMTPPVSYTVNKNGRKPFAVMNPRAVLAGGNDITLTWSRRNRSQQTMIDGTALTDLDETTEEYRVEIYSGSTLVRTVTGLTSPTYTYTSANQTTDGFTPPLVSLKVIIYQVSSVAGLGFGRSVTLDVE